MIRRNDELALLYEKLRVQQSALKAGEIHYAARQDDLRLMKIKVRDLVRENALTAGSGSQIEDLKREILHLQKELLQEKTKVIPLPLPVCLCLWMCLSVSLSLSLCE